MPKTVPPTEELVPNMLASNANCTLLFARPFECVSGLVYLQYFSKSVCWMGYRAVGSREERASQKVRCCDSPVLPCHASVVHPTTLQYCSPEDIPYY